MFASNLAWSITLIETRANDRLRGESDRDAQRHLPSHPAEMWVAIEAAQVHCYLTLPVYALGEVSFRDLPARCLSGTQAPPSAHVRGDFGGILQREFDLTYIYFKSGVEIIRIDQLN